MKSLFLLLAVVCGAATVGAAQPAKPAVKSKASLSVAGKDLPPLYAPGSPVTVRLAKAVVLDYEPESLNPRINEYFPAFDKDSVKAVLRRAQLVNWPAGINTAEKFSAHGSEIANYNAYRLFEYMDISKDDRIVLVWIPRSENGHMPGEMVPATAEGIYMAVRAWTIAPRVSGRKRPPGAPQAPQKGLTKELPITIEYLQQSVVHHMDAAGLERAKAALVGSGKFPEPAFNEMVNRADMSNFPPALNSVQKIGASASFHATGYVQGSFLLPFNGVAQWTHLVWVPMADNSGLNAEFKDGKDMFFFTVSRAFKSKEPAYTWSKDAVAAMKAKHNKAIPEAIPKDLITSAEPASYKALRDAGYTEAEAGRIMQLCSEVYLPEGLEYDYWQARYAAIQQLKAYRIAEYQQGVGTARLYWIPKEENAAAPADLRPMTEEGAFVSAFISRSAEDKAITSRVYANKPEWEYYPDLYRFYARGGTDAQLTEMAKTSATVGSGELIRLGVMIIYYGDKSTNTLDKYAAWTLVSRGDLIKDSRLKNPARVADKLADRTAGAGEYIGYYFLGRGDCNDAEAYMCRKLGVPKSKIRFYGSCEAEEYIKNE